MPSNPLLTRRQALRLAAGGTAALALAACSGTGGTGTAVSSTDTATTAPSSAAASSAPASGTATAAGGTTAGSGLFDSSTVHTVSLSYVDTDYQAMIAAYVANGDKNWLTASVTIDGTTLDNVGIKLKGNSTLRGLAGDSGGGGGGLGGDLSADEPEGLPWRVRLDKYVDGQNFQGQTDVVVRGGNSETGLNEAVALELIGAAGLATEEAASIRFSVNGGATTLRLVIQNPTDEWYAENFDSAGILYKAEADGDYSYRGDDSASYTEAFEVEASTTGEDDYTPLIAFLKFVNESDDATFAAELATHLDVDAFTTYLAVQDLVANTDDIDGPGNNSYLRCDTATGVFTVVAWDQNLSFGGMGGMGGGAGGGMRGGAAGGAMGQPPAGGGGGQRPTDAYAAGGATGNAAGGFGDNAGGGRGGNILATRFKADTDLNAGYLAKLAGLKTDLYASGAAQKILDTWVGVLTAQATDLVPAATITSEASAISAFFTAS